ncbi:MAG: DUF4339 domain-containing protein [bacterium]
MLSTPKLGAARIFFEKAERDRHLNTRGRIGRHMDMAMIHINRNRENIGKFNDQDVADGLRSGRFLPTDLAWREPMASWQPLSTFTDLPPPEESPEPHFPNPEIASGPDGSRLVLGECFSNGWESFQKNMGTLMLGTFVFLVVSLSLWFVSEVAESVAQIFAKRGAGGQEQLLKIVAIVVGVFFSILSSTGTTILSAGFLWMFIKNARGKSEFADIFAGFSKGTWLEILIAGMVSGAIIVALALVTLAPSILLSDHLGSPLIAGIGFMLFLIPMAYLSVGLGFIFPLILDHRLGWREAMGTALRTVHKQWFATSGLILLYTLVSLSGLALCCVGIIFTMPIGYSIWAQGYRQLFGDPDKSSEGD